MIPGGVSAEEGHNAWVGQDSVNDAELRDLLVRHLIARSGDRDALLAALHALEGMTDAPSLLDLAEAVERSGRPQLDSLAVQLERQLLKLAARGRILRSTGRPWTPGMDRELERLVVPGAEHASRTSLLAVLERLVHLRRDLAFARAHTDALAGAEWTIEQAYRRALDSARDLALPWRLFELSDSAAECDAADDFVAEKDPLRRQALFREVLGLTDDRLALALRAARPEELLRVAMALVLRSGVEGASASLVVRSWLDGYEGFAERVERDAHRMLEDFEPELRAVQADLAADAPSLERLPPPALDMNAFRSRWNLTAPRKPEPVAPVARAAAPEPPPTPAATPTPKPAPSAWNEHIQPFLLENWHFAIGALMVVVGASLLAYFTWDRHWLVRYTVLPALLGTFTAALAGLGGWLERRDDTLRGTAAVLRGAAIGLLPINFMTVALLAADPTLGHPLLIVPLVAGLYMAAAGWGLRRWCEGVQPGLGKLLGGTLLALCCLVVLRPIALTLAVSEAPLRILLGAGFYLGFVAVALAVFGFTSRVLTPEVARDKRVPWFFGATLIITLLQVFVWVHASMGYLPRVYTYAPMVIAAGALLLHIERRALHLIGADGRLEAESFLGFALILLGLLMAQMHPWVRVIGFAMAGTVWLWQAPPRRHPLHAWIGLTLIALAVASIGMLDGFPSTARPWLGIALAVAGGAGARLFAARGKELLARTAHELQVAVLVLTVPVAVLGQWHDHSAPLATAAVLLVAAAGLAWRAHRESHERWLLTSCVVLAMALPYLGCVDLEGRSVHGNTMVFGLSVLSLLWIALDRVAPSVQTRRARSTVLWFYGALAVAGMVVRVVIERRTPGDLLWYRALMDHTGPILASVALAYASYWSRSLVPGGMAAVILILLFPELRSHYHEAFDRIGWGSGMGSAVGGSVLVVACFLVRGSRHFRALGPGDRFLGTMSFPLQRRDYTLFTWPLAASAIFLLAKVLTILLATNMEAGMTWRASAAQCVAGGGWLLLAAYGRQYAQAKGAVAIAFLQILLGVSTWNLIVARSDAPAQALLIYLVVIQALHAGAIRRPWMHALYREPARLLLRSASLILAPLLVFALAVDPDPQPYYLLSLFIGAQLAWHGIATRQVHYGTLLFPLIWFGVMRVSMEHGKFALTGDAMHHLAKVSAVLVLVLQGLQAVADRRASWYALVRPLLRPMQGWSALVVAGAATSVMVWTLQVDALQVDSLVLSALAALAVARANRSGLYALIGAVLFYALVCEPAWRGFDGFEARVTQALTPWRWSLFGLSLAAVGLGGVRLRRLLAGPHPIRFDRFAPRDWLFGAAIVVAASAALLHAFNAEWQEDSAQLLAPYIAAATFALVSIGVRRPVALFGSAALFAIGNVQVVDVLAGPWLLDHGASPIQIICIGISITVVTAMLVHRWTSRPALIATADRTAAFAAGFVLVLLAAQYLAESDVSAMTTERLLVSGALAFAAAQAFRELARRPRGEHPFPVVAAEPAYHLGLTVSLWCVALLFPPLRQPAATLVALSVPFFFLLFRAETEWRAQSETAHRYRRSAMVLGYLLIALIALRSVFQIVLFPGTPVLTDHYHHNSILLILLGLGLIRLHALGGGYWVGFYGGLALIIGSYFAVTAFPGLSPFEFPVAAGWALIALGHFWTLASAARSPLRAGIQTLGGIDDDVWHQMRTGWAFVVLAATQLPVFMALYADADTRMLAPLLAGSATIVAHHGLRRRSRAFLFAAGAEFLLALHLDFLVPSLVPRTWVVWIVLGAWAALLVSRRLPRMAAYATGALVFAHVLYQGPSTAIGLWAFAAATLLILGTRQRLPEWNAADEGWTAGLLLAPTWLAYFGAVHAGYDYRDAWPIVLAAGTLLLTGALAEWIHRKTPAPILARRPVLFDKLRSLLHTDGARVRTTAVYAAFALAGAVFLLHYDAPYEIRTIFSLCAVFAACAAGFRLDGVERHAMLPYFLMQFSALALFATIRRQLILTTDFWTQEYDVWAACLTSVVFAGAKEIFDLRPREARVPVTTALFALPVVAMVWTVVHGLGTNVALLIVGIHSLVYAFLGKDDRESPYNLVAVAGFVGFVVLTFWSKLELRSMQAYAVPVAIGMLVLVQLFRARLSSQLVNQIRVAAALAIVGSAASEALIDDRYPIGFHVSLLLLSLAIMAIGSFLRVRVYLIAGAAGVLVGLASITYRGLAGLERAAQMSAIGLLVLVLGTGLVAGATYYKTHRDSAHATFEKWRRRLGEWD